MSKADWPEASFASSTHRCRRIALTLKPLPGFFKFMYNADVQESFVRRYYVLWRCVGSQWNRCKGSARSVIIVASGEIQFPGGRRGFPL